MFVTEREIAKEPFQISAVVIANGQKLLTEITLSAKTSANARFFHSKKYLVRDIEEKEAILTDFYREVGSSFREFKRAEKYLTNRNFDLIESTN